MPRKKEREKTWHWPKKGKIHRKVRRYGTNGEVVLKTFNTRKKTVQVRRRKKRRGKRSKVPRGKHQRRRREKGETPSPLEDRGVKRVEPFWVKSVRCER